LSLRSFFVRRLYRDKESCRCLCAFSCAAYIARTGEIVLFTLLSVQSGLRSVTRDIQNAGSSQITVRDQIVVYVRIRSVR
jgi:hypothetical protein